VPEILVKITVKYRYLKRLLVETGPRKRAGKSPRKGPGPHELTGLFVFDMKTINIVVYL